MKKTVRNFAYVWLSAFLFLHPAFAFPQPIKPAAMDTLVLRTMRTFDVPGIAVAVVKDNKIIFSKGYGVRSLKTGQKVDSNTLFGIASNSKAFTTAALGMLVDEKKLSWDDKVIDYIPEFRLYDPYVTESFTIRDLMTHRSGMGLGAGDLMIWPSSNEFTLQDIIHNLRYLKPVSGFRTKFDYDNLLYIVAGEIVARVSGLSWESFIETRIMRPLEMTQSAASFSRLKDKSNVIDPHAPVDGLVRVVDRDNNETANAAGGIYSNLTDMCRWIIMQMNNGRYGEGLTKQLFSKEVHNEMWAAQTIMRVADSTEYNTHFACYGLGWFLNDVNGYKEVWHTGGLAGIVTQVTLIPELKLGIIVLTNQQSGNAFRSITNSILDSYFGIKGIDRVSQYQKMTAKSLQNEANVNESVMRDIEAQKRKPGCMIADTLFTGVYSDKWFGDVLISLKNGELRFDSKKSPGLTGRLIPYKGNTLIVRWDDRSMDADAFMVFNFNSAGVGYEIKMKAISPLTDFSYDFQDLDLIRKN